MDTNEFLGIFLPVLALAIVLFRHGFMHILDNMKANQETRDSYIRKLKNPKFKEVYLNTLENILRKIGNWFGKPFSIKALNMNTSLSVFYAILLFFITWMFGGTGSLGNLAFFKNSLSIDMRILFGLISTGTLMIFLKHKEIDLLITKEKKIFTIIIPTRILKPVYYIFSTITIFTTLIISGVNLLNPVCLTILGILLYSPIISIHSTILIFLSTNISFSANVVNFSVSNVEATFTIIAVILAVAISIREKIVKGAGMFAVLIVFGTSLAPGSAGPVIVCSILIVYLLNSYLQGNHLYFYSLAILAILILLLLLDIVNWKGRPTTDTYFLVFLPFINGIFDYISLAISRKLSYRILKKRSFKTILIHIAIDLFLAIILLVFLISFIVIGTGLFDIYINSPDRQFDTQKIINITYQRPLSLDGGLWVTVMIFSTLIPTLVHVLMALSGIFTFLTPERIRINLIKKLREYKKKKSRVLLTMPAMYFPSIYTLSILSFLIILGTFVLIVNTLLPNIARILCKIAHLSLSLLEFL